MSIPIHVCIPSYNNAAGLKLLLSDLTTQSFTSITVLDDASTDTTAEVVAAFPDVTRICSEKNLGTVGANNLILRSVPEDGFLLCIDSDMRVVTQDMAQVLRTFIQAHPNIGVGVGKIVNAENQRIRWNFNYDINPIRAILSFFTYHPAVFLKNVPYLGRFTRRLSLLFTMHLADDVEQKVDWGIEGFFFVCVDLFQQLQGFDSRFKRYHEGPDLFLQIRKMGFETWYTPSIVMQDFDQASGTPMERKYHWWRSMAIYFWKNPSRLFLYKYPRP